MDVVQLSEQLQAFFQTERTALAAEFPSVTRLMQIVVQFFWGLSVPSHWHLRDIERSDRGWHFRWQAQIQAVPCPGCHAVRQRSAHAWTDHTVQDLPLDGRPVWHTVTIPRYLCKDSRCPIYTFVDPMQGVAGPGARLSHRLKTAIIRLALTSNIHRLPAALRAMGILVSRDTVLRLVKAQGAIVIAQNLARLDVKVLDVDDVNFRKGHGATAHTVFIDGESHRFLLLVQGATQAITEAVMAKWPTVQIVSRDRGSAYGAAAAACDTEQVADGFHLVDNLHDAIQQTLTLSLGSDVFLPQGDGWLSDTEPTSAASKPGPRLSLAPADRERRIRLARLTQRQAKKYRTTLQLLELADSGLRSANVAERLNITRSTLRRYRKEAPATIAQVESKLDAWLEAEETPAAELPIKTLAPGARPASESIVAPYHDTVLRLAADGQGHQKIHAAIVEQGFGGSANAVYQYLLKVRREQALVSEGPLNDSSEGEAKERPMRIGVERIASHTIYQRILHEVAQERAPIGQARTGLVASEIGTAEVGTSEVGTPETATAAMEVGITPEPASVPDAQVRNTHYDDPVAALIFDTRTREAKPGLQLSPETYVHLEATVPIVAQLRKCLASFMTMLDTHDEVALDRFIDTYQQDPAEPIATFASGLAKDLAAVKNHLRYPTISNGPMEGTNNKIKMVRRRSYGRAGVELVNALMALPWYYADLDRAQSLSLEAA